MMQEIFRHCIKNKFFFNKCKQIHLFTKINFNEKKSDLFKIMSSMLHYSRIVKVFIIIAFIPVIIDRLKIKVSTI